MMKLYSHLSLFHHTPGMKMLDNLPRGKVKELCRLLDENEEWEELVPDEKPLSEVNRMMGRYYRTLSRVEFLCTGSPSQTW